MSVNISEIPQCQGLLRCQEKPMNGRYVPDFPPVLRRIGVQTWYFGRNQAATQKLCRSIAYQACHRFICSPEWHIFSWVIYEGRVCHMEHCVIHTRPVSCPLVRLFQRPSRKKTDLSKRNTKILAVLLTPHQRPINRISFTHHLNQQEDFCRSVF